MKSSLNYSICIALLFLSISYSHNSLLVQYSKGK